MWGGAQRRRLAHAASQRRYRDGRSPEEAARDRAVNREQQRRGRPRDEYANYEYNATEAVVKFYHDAGAGRFPRHERVVLELREGAERPSVEAVDGLREEIERQWPKLQDRTDILKRGARGLDERMAAVATNAVAVFAAIN